MRCIDWWCCCNQPRGRIQKQAQVAISFLLFMLWRGWCLEAQGHFLFTDFELCRCPDCPQIRCSSILEQVYELGVIERGVCQTKFLGTGIALLTSLLFVHAGLQDNGYSGHFPHKYSFSFLLLASSFLCIFSVFIPLIGWWCTTHHNNRFHYAAVHRVLKDVLDWQVSHVHVQ